eukprot:scaffold35166_cov50-Attheya_sp.AAC.2
MGAHGFTLNNHAALTSRNRSCRQAKTSTTTEIQTERNSGMDRRNYLKVAASAFVSFSIGTGPVGADDGDSPTIFVKGIASLPSDYVAPAGGDMTALYVTVRPDRADNVPAAILSGTRGKPPPILAARFENPTFPFEFILSTKDLTGEGVSTESGDQEVDRTRFWWKEDDLVVSARLDSDGVAATRSPDDLVGRGFLKHSETGLNVKVPLTGRGAFGKFATGAKK